MATARRTGTETSETRAKLLDVTERVMIDDGYAAVSSRRIAKEAGVTPALIHYYFPTLDDLFLEVVRRRGKQQFERQQRFLESDRPLRSLWSFSSDPAGAVLFMELMALANHRKSIRTEVAEFADRFRQAQIEALSGHLQERGIDVPPEVVLVLVSALSNTLVMESELGMEVGGPEARAWVE